MPDDSADSQPTNSTETPQTEEGQPEPQDSATIPDTMLQGKQFKVGDSITLKVVAVGDDGIEVELPEEQQSQGEEYPEPNSEIDSMAAQGG